MSSKIRWHTLDSERAAPIFSLTNALTRAKASLDDYEAKRLIITFLPGVWAPWCRKMLAELNESLPEVQQSKCDIIAIISQNSTELRKYLVENEIKLDVLADPHGVVCKRYGIFDRYIQEPMKISKPAIFILDKDRLIRHTFIGNHLMDRPKMEEILEKAAEPLRNYRPKLTLFHFLRRILYVGN